MFGLFRRKPKSTGEKILEQLGRSAQGIVSAAAESSDTMVGLKGAATVAVIIRESDRCFGIGVEEERRERGHGGNGVNTEGTGSTLYLIGKNGVKERTGSTLYLIGQTY